MKYLKGVFGRLFFTVNLTLNLIYHLAVLILLLIVSISSILSGFALLFWILTNRNFIKIIDDVYDWLQFTITLRK